MDDAKRAWILIKEWLEDGKPLKMGEVVAGQTDRKERTTHTDGVKERESESEESARQTKGSPVGTRAFLLGGRTGPGGGGAAVPLSSRAANRWSPSGVAVTR
jgi:hypothetical protein